MTCICCKTNSVSARGHIISNFIRKRVTGIETRSGKRFEFHWSGQKGPTQDLQKRLLMCKACDNGAGSAIEERSATLLMPPDPSNPDQWDEMPLVPVELLEFAGEPFKLAYYDYESSADQDYLDAFALLTAWRAVHALALDGQPAASKFLNSPKGKAVDIEVADYLHEVHTSNQIAPQPVPTAALYWQGPRMAVILSGKDDEMPFAWAVLEDQEPLGVAVLFGFWVILWPFFDESDEPEKYETLKRKCFIDWNVEIMAWQRR